MKTMARQELNLNEIDFDRWANNWYIEKSKYPFWIDIKIQEPLKVNDILKINIYPCENIQLAHKYLTEKKKQKRIYKEELCLINEKLTKETAAQLTTALKIIDYAHKGLLTYEKIAYIIQVCIFHFDFLMNNYYNMDSILGGTWKELDLGNKQERMEYIKYANRPVWELKKVLNAWNNNLAKYADVLFRTTDKRAVKVIYFTIPPRWLTHNELPKIYKENDEFSPKEVIWIDSRYVPIMEDFYSEIKININKKILDFNIDLELNIFRKIGKAWFLQYAGIQAGLKDSKGLNYIAYLLAHPYEEFYVGDLRKITEKFQTSDKYSEYQEYSKMDKEEIKKHSLKIIKTEEGIKKSSTKTKEEYKERYHQLEEELADAKEFYNQEKIEEIYEEMEILKKEIKSSFDLKGRPRIELDDEESDRKTIGNDISNTIKAIRKQNKSLADYLKKFINTSSYCSYTPEKLTNWQF